MMVILDGDEASVLTPTHRMRDWGTSVTFIRPYISHITRYIYLVIFSEHFSLNTFSIDKRTHSYIKNVTEQCIIHHADLDLTNTICHNVFTCKEEKCALPFPTEEVIRQACSRLDFNYEKCNDLNQERCFKIFHCKINLAISFS